MKYYILLPFLLLSICLFGQEKGASPISIPKTGSTYAVVVGISDYQSPDIPDLRFASRKVLAIDPILKSNGYQSHTLRGGDASEAAFKAIGSTAPSPKVLHIATHGFFFPDVPPTGADERNSVGEKNEPFFKVSEQPMMRSGLIMAGTNYAWENGRPMRPGMEDGILTAYEISQMNLSNTMLVVLSACEKGLGDIQGNEGVCGLQRAFKIAGAKNIIMPLWQVPDFQTQELMTTFYTKWLLDKMTIQDAFRAAQKEMREKYQNPFFWAGFVLLE
ncbi:MAG: CHAT domain-containing protein [Bacteroidetes bacterium]|nr:CHAT domain-containing protein [Bacteroidota bacterium]